MLLMCVGVVGMRGVVSVGGVDYVVGVIDCVVHCISGVRYVGVVGVINDTRVGSVDDVGGLYCVDVVDGVGGFGSVDVVCSVRLTLISLCHMC